MKALALALLASLAFAHEGHDHGAPAAGQEETLALIATAYEAKVKPIFERACFDCHSGTTKYPWYYKVPGVKQLIDRDIEEAKEHMDMSNGYPFKGHASPKKDLEELVEAVDEGEMPPWSYRLMHSSARLTKEEKELVKAWAREGAKSLK